LTRNTFDSNQQDRLCNEVLTSIEGAEARLLHWGFIRVQNDLKTVLPEILDNLPDDTKVLWETAAQAGFTPDDVLTNLLDRKLIFASKEMYRSRFAETVRLLSLLRQLLPYNTWQTASRLVSDIRIQLQRRRYPRRDIPIDELLTAVQEIGVGAVHRQAVRQLLSLPDGTTFNLAQFQVEAILQQFRNLQVRGDRGLVIGAGTGAGKTKAFYIPALAEIAAALTTSSTSYATRALAVYPRIELLKDQLAEAYTESRKLDTMLKQQNKRLLTLGAYYGDTPISAKTLFEHPEWYQSWRPTEGDDGLICPYLPCPDPDCDSGELVWSRADMKQESQENQRNRYGRYSRLRCQTCGTEVNHNHLLLTRDQMIASPPDILFTTTEMLNRRLSRTSEHALFGIGVSSPPRLLLLDEIHTYEGLTGTQVAYLLRRWRYARGATPHHNLCVVGLSATLSQAEHFFARLTGIPLYHIQYICPHDDDMIEEGVEYNLVLKGDPVSGTSLLSTSVQTAMLLGRILDPMDQPVSRGAYGQKLFAFTDKLDVINRWYHIEADAETQKCLSQHRRRNSLLGSNEKAQRNDMGQWWWLCENIGHNLQTPLILDLTSSQYRGVRQDANLVIATSTLEVGFNDSAVGAVLQHKSPRSLASFLQRKGRAGRTRAMRPWMVVVTSAYGRDRWAFQHAETLFNPTLRPIDLPLENVYVRKIQAAFALMDWLALKLKTRWKNADVWELLSSHERTRTDYCKLRRHQMCEVLEGVLDGRHRKECAEYLQGALGLQDDERAMQTILWGEPRPLLLEVLPTLLRQLESDWQRVEEGNIYPWSDHTAASPMPDFVPANLFSVLNLPELVLHIPDKPERPSAYRTGTGSDASPGLRMRDDEHLPLAVGMVEFAPGHVSKRHSRSHLVKEAHWLELPEKTTLDGGKLPLKSLKVEYDDEPQRIDVDGVEYLCYRPRAYTLGLLPRSVKSTSTGYLVWCSHFSPQQQSEASGVGAEDRHDQEAADRFASHLSLAPDSRWGGFLQRIKAYIQANGAWVEVTRLAVAVQLDTRYENGTSTRRRLDFEADGNPAGLGFRSYVDALRFAVLPLDTHHLLSLPAWRALYQHLGPAYFLHRLQHDPRLKDATLSTFEIEWLWQLVLSMLVATAIARQCTLAEAAEETATNLLPRAKRTFQVIFQSQQPEEDQESQEIDGRLQRTLMGHLSNQVIVDALFENVAVLWSEPDSELETWLQQCYVSSLGAVLFAAVTQLVPDLDPDELVMDMDSEAIWISEKTAGGLGLIAKIADAIARHPHEFDLQMLDTIQNCDREQLAIQLRAVATLIDQAYEVLSPLFEQTRNDADIPTQEATRQQLSRALEEHGIPATRELIVALNTRFLRPNSGSDTDQLIAMLVRHWKAEEQRLGCAVDLRVMAVAARQIPEIESQVQMVLRRIGGNDNAPPDESQIFNLFQSLLWLDCQNSCPDCIEQRFPYQHHELPSRALLMALLAPDARPIDYGEDAWDEQVRQLLATHFHVQIACEQHQLDACKGALLDMLTQPIEIGFQFFFPVVERIVRRGKQWFIDVVIRELIRV
jgi:hypothetical protein